ncbi:SCO4225 family membrane protein [Streptomyces corynorhini]|uniref:Uncharacterized protein n=1 Tax=Streptomyces corynorhini TaxID=2282652 RepID=A0A370BD87_9ACTN|nr:hypothetical protein [Streptomyces corynorhini]RDG38204.1 hypothetical protein DVH02_10415 [Streptomyces corynorhini]
MADAPRSLPQNLRHYLVNPAALGYLGLVLAVCAWVAVATLPVGQGDFNFAVVWPFFVTAPTSFMFVGYTDWLPAWAPVWTPLIGVPVGAAVQAFVIGALYRSLRKGKGSPNSGTSPSAA